AIFSTLSLFHKAWDYDQVINDLTGALALAQHYRREKYKLIDLYDQIIEIINLREAQINEQDKQIVELQEDLLQANLQVDAYQEQVDTIITQAEVCPTCEMNCPNWTGSDELQSHKVP
ncbi:hypothetical protein FRC11_015001, partial [Ceratobasidium sp. 423]